MNLTVTFAKPIAAFKKKFNSQFIRNLGWLGGAEVINRVLRLFTTVILARSLSEYDYGLAALVLTTNEFTQVFTRIGIGGKIIQADEKDLEALCRGAYWLNWAICCGLFVIQSLSAFGVAWFYQDNQLVTPIFLLGLVYLITPLGRIQAVLIQRENRLKITAFTGVVILGLINIFTAIFALLGMGMWAIILPRILIAPVDILINMRYHPWRINKGFTTEKWGEIFKFGISILGISMLDTLRNNLDYLIVGRFIGIKEVGIYYFAFNAGLGISSSIIQSITFALYPHLCEARANWLEFKKRYFSSMKTIASIVIPFVLLQSLLAPFYVPIVFGKDWINAIPILMIICLSAIPRPFFLAANNLLLAVNKPHLSLRGNVLFTLVFGVGLLIAVQWQPPQYESLGIAIGVLLTHVIFMPVFTVWVSRYVFAGNEDRSFKQSP